MNAESLAALYLNDIRSRMNGVRVLAEQAMAQLPSGGWHAVLGPDENSVAVLVQHLSGNMHSRWSNLLSEDGESGHRDRDAEFEDAGLSTDALWERWQSGWAVFQQALDHLGPADLTRSLTIRGETHTVLEAIQRQVAHYSGHVYQIVLLARHWTGPGWKTLSIARGQSAAFNLEMRDRHQR